MQTHSQNMPLLFASPMAVQGASPIPSDGSQLSDLSAKSGELPFLQSLQGLVSELQLAGKEGDAGALSSAIEELITSQVENNDLGLPLAAGQMVAAQEQTEVASELASPISVEGLLQQIQQGLTNTTTELDPALQARIAALASSQAATVEAGNINQSASPINTLDLMKQPANLNQVSLKTNPADSMAQVGSLNQALPVSTLVSQQQIKLGEVKQVKDTEISPLLNRDASLNTTTTTAASLSPILMERALFNMNQAGHQVATEMHNSTDVPLETLATLQTGQPNRSSVQGGIVETRPQQAMIQVPLTDPQWQTDFSNRIVMLAKGAGPGQAQVAEIRLNPAHMGAIEVRVVMNDDQASVTFTAQHGAVRDAIDASLPRLREMFTSSGLLLSDAEVSDQSLHDRRQNDNQGLANKGQQHSDSEFHLDGESAHPVAQLDLTHLVSSNTLDLYA